ncbi:MAG: pilus assembly protein [Burkholderiaceae bacterium]|nr:pilus assembly protein [Burkholderiaceae bacterium]
MIENACERLNRRPAGAGSANVGRAAPRYATGVASLEWLLALPVILILVLGAVQAGLVWHGREVLQLALEAGARSGAVGHASRAAVIEGLALGWRTRLAPENASSTASALRPLVLARLHTQMAGGVLQLSRLSPDPDAFADWAVPARDPYGELIAGVQEIPNDNLRYRDASTGARSGLSLLDANLLKLRVDAGLPLVVPFVGRLWAWIMRHVDACEVQNPRWLGPVQVRPARLDGVQRPWRCRFYQFAGADGIVRPYWPVRVHAISRMQSSARDDADWREAGRSADAGTEAGPIATGSEGSPSASVSDPVTGAHDDSSVPGPTSNGSTASGAGSTGSIHDDSPARGADASGTDVSPIGEQARHSASDAQTPSDDPGACNAIDSSPG